VLAKCWPRACAGLNGWSLRPTTWPQEADHRHGSPRSAARFVVVGLACLAGGVLLELVNGALTAADLILFRDTWDVLIAMTEESIELAGWILVAGALLSVLCGRLVEQGLGVAARGASGGRA